MSRPESDDRGYEPPKGYDEGMGEEFTPWRPGDPSASGEAPASYTAAGGAVFEGRGPRDPGRVAGGKEQGADHDQEQPQTRWWTEDSVIRWEAGDKVRSRDTVRGSFMAHVPAGTRGRVVDKRMGALSGEWLTVEFDNGYTEIVRPDALRRDSWF